MSDPPYRDTLEGAGLFMKKQAAILSNPQYYTCFKLSLMLHHSMFRVLQLYIRRT